LAKQRIGALNIFRATLAHFELRSAPELRSKIALGSTSVKSGNGLGGARHVSRRGSDGRRRQYSQSEEYGTWFHDGQRSK
jgi:hypothetical protein